MILAGNFKMNHTRASTREYLKKLTSCDLEGLEVFIFPPFTALDRYEGKVVIGAQNGYGARSGSFTGEIGLEQLEEFGINTLLLGHSERRHLLNENQELLSQKFNFYKKANFNIFFCVGETLEVRESGSKELIKAYLKAQLEGIDLEYPNLIIAYEPVWAIGTGKTASLEEIEEVLEYLSTLTSAPLLYGGSVKAQNIASIASLKNCSGVLVGSASWKVDSFCEMVKKVKEIL